MIIQAGSFSSFPLPAGAQAVSGDLTLLPMDSPLLVHMHTSLRSSSKALCPLLFLYDLTVSEELADKCELPMDWGEERFHSQELVLLFERGSSPSTGCRAHLPLARRVLGMGPASC